MSHCWRQKRKRNKVAAAAAVVVAVAVVAATIRKQKKIGQGKGISPQHNTSHKSLSPYPQQYSPSPTLEETLAILRTISPRDPRGHKEREPEPKQPKLQQYAGLMEIIERFHEIMMPIIEKEKKKPQVMLPGQYKHYPNKDGLMFFYQPKNYHPTPIPRPKDVNLSEEQWKQFDGDTRQGVVPYCL
ncbi:MAG: hypothetical protein EZS28_010496 [Streblomastix strix]|uniref:Uncharacterized protein n=1 Tax=Streblomastix strix TaxID=222440 RepID=A0A5J4WHD6_9EUKA|nr:MAG: hypothetical protein EZS28_010496 [Streblomastix strix]